MTNESTPGYAIGLSERLAGLGGLLTANPTCAVGMIDAARTIGDAGPALADIGISVAGHRRLQARALVEVISVSDVWLVSDIALEASAHGSAMRNVRLRDGQHAQLHLIEIRDDGLQTVAIIVPNAGETIATLPAATAVAASPRIGELLCDAYGVITSSSPSALALLGSSVRSIDGTPIVLYLHADDRETAIANWMAAKEQRGVALRWRFRLARFDGSYLWVESTITNEIDLDGDGAVRFNLYDISAEVAATEALIAERELIELLTETLPVGVAKFDALGHLEHANQRLTELLAPLDPRSLLWQAVSGEVEDVELRAAFAELLDDGVASRLVVDHLGVGGAVCHLEWTIRAAVGADGTVTGGVVCIADVTEAAVLRDALEHRASTDALTGCLNRAGTVAALEAALACARPDEGTGLLFIDLDDFKRVNDTRGHAVGDAVLEVVASRLRGALRPRDLVGRLGGDEFVVISPGMESNDSALAFATRISCRLQGPASIDGAEVPVSASIGVAWTSTGSAGELLGAADAAMYTAKQRRSACPVVAQA